MLRILTNRVDDLGHLTALGNKGEIGRSKLSDASLSDGSISDGSLTIEAGASTRPMSGNSTRSVYTTESTPSNFGNRNSTAMDELIKKCCTETSKSNSELRDEVKVIHSDLLQKWNEFGKALKKTTNDSGKEIREIIRGRFDTQDTEISQEFSHQTEAMEHHEQQIEQVVEQTGQTMQTILSILENHDAFTRKLSGEHGEIMQQLSKISEQSLANTTTLTNAVEKTAGERGKAISEVNSNTTKAVSEFVKALAVLRELYDSHERHTLGMIEETRELVDEIKQSILKTTISQAKSGGKKRIGNRELDPDESPLAGSARPTRAKEVSDVVQKKGDPMRKK
jgi:gas vesicle protein